MCVYSLKVQIVKLWIITALLECGVRLSNQSACYNKHLFYTGVLLFLVLSFTTIAQGELKHRIDL